MYFSSEGYTQQELKPFRGNKFAQDTIPATMISDSLIEIGTQIIPHDSLPAPETDKFPVKENIKSVEQEVKIADEGLDSEVTYGARDTMWMNSKENEVHLFGQAFVNYENMKLNAGYIVLNIETNIAEARSLEDTHGHQVQKPTFNDGTQEVKYNALRYNFETHKGVVLDAISAQSGMIVHGARTKYISAKKDSLIEDDLIFNQNALITTCNHEHPHYGFRASKLKVVPDKIAVVGPANLEIAGIPTPLFIPFGFFPLAEGQSTGFIFPQDYEYSPTKGFGLRDFGWYFPINDFWDLTLTGDLYTRGSFGLKANSRYKKRYKYNGSFNISFDNTLVEDRETATNVSRKSFGLTVTHTQDPKAHPYRSLGGSISFSTNDYNAFTQNDASSVLTTSYSSNFYFRHKMPNTPFNFSGGLSHSQNTQTHRLDITFPDLTLNMPTQTPFKRKGSKSGEKWYESISVNYTSKFKNFIETTDTTVFQENLLEKMYAGMQHEAGTALNLKFLKYINFNANASYTERWYLKTEEEFYNEISERDTTIDVNGFRTFRTFRSSAGINTQLFLTKNFKRGPIRGFRHKLTPKFSFSYGPDTRSRYEEFYLDAELDTTYYNPFSVRPFSSSLSDESASFNYQFDNNLEIKYFSKKDSTMKKVKIFDSFTLRGSNNLIADSLNWSTVTLNGSSRFFKGITTMTFRFVFDPYLEENNRRINQTVWSDRKKLLRMDNGFIKITNRFSVKKLKELFGKKKKKASSRQSSSEANASVDTTSRGEDLNSENPIRRNKSPDNREEDFERVSFGSLFDNLSFVHDLQYDFNEIDGVDTSFVNRHSLSFSGSLPLTPNWNVRIGNVGYDLKDGGLNYPSFTFTRKLHCWNMNFTWSPNRDTYTFFIGVSSNTFNFLKYNYGQNILDGATSRF